MSPSSLPDGPGLFGWQGTWSFINRPRYFYAWLRRRYGEIATLKTATAPLVIALTSEGARQVLTANPEGYNAFHKEPFTGLTGVGSLWVIDGLRHRRERQLLSPRFSAHRI